MKRKIIAYIPARIEPNGKILKNLQGKPLLAHTIEAAITSKIFDKIVLSSNDKKILRLAKKYVRKIVTDSRPDFLTTPQATPINSLLEYVHRQSVSAFSSLALLLPTSPLRSPLSLVEGAKLLTPEIDAVISVSRYLFPLRMAMTVNLEGKIKPFFKNSPLVSGGTIDDQASCYYPNGGFFYSWRSSFSRYANFYKGKVLPFQSPEPEGWMINNDLDIKIAESLAKIYERKAHR